ncbi:hypothetical protein ACS0TY_010942 [Phlomoides rotata]
MAAVQCRDRDLNGGAVQAHMEDDDAGEEHAVVNRIVPLILGPGFGLKSSLNSLCKNCKRPDHFAR